MDKNNENIVWEDRKRICGIPCTFTKYYIDEDRLYIKSGLLKTEINEILLYRILDIKSSRTLLQKIFGVGTVTIFSADQSDRTLQLVNIKDSEKVHKLISNIVEKERRERSVVGKELFGTAGHDMDHIDGICDSHDCDYD